MLLWASGAPAVRRARARPELRAHLEVGLQERRAFREASDLGLRYTVLKASVSVCVQCLHGSQKSISYDHPSHRLEVCKARLSRNVRGVNMGVDGVSAR